jgi:hypothetical protein
VCEAHPHRWHCHGVAWHKLGASRHYRRRTWAVGLGPNSRSLTVGRARYGVPSLLLYTRDEDATERNSKFFEFWRVLEHMQDSLAAALV